MDLQSLSNSSRPYKRRKLRGRGPGSGNGKTAGRGHKGDKSRSGYKRRGAKEGGQLPLFQRLPRRGFSNERFAISVFEISLGRIDELFEDGEKVSRETLLDKGFPLRRIPRIKVLSTGELTKKVSIEAFSFSKGAVEKLEKQSIEFKTV